MYVKGLPDATTKDALFAAFEHFGPVNRAFILYNHKNGTSRGFGFIEFVNDTSVAGCLGKLVNIEGKDLVVSKALERTKKVVQNNSRKKKKLGN